MSKKWTSEEINIVKENYEIMSNEDIINKFNIQRTSNQIMDYASTKLGLHKPKGLKTKNRGWSKEDDLYLTKVYAYENKYIIMSKLNKEWATVRARAIKLKLSRSNEWKDEEIYLLHKFYPYMKTEDFKEKYSINREVASINMKANSLNIYKDEVYLEKMRKLVGINNLSCIGDTSGENNARWKDRMIVKCDTCGKDIEKQQHLLTKYKRFFCCQECLSIGRKKFNKGENNPNFANGKAWSKEMRLKMAKISTRRIVNKEYSFTETKPQLIINNILNEMSIKYTNEYDCKYYAMDNYLTESNLMIEVQGNFFHCNPTMNYKNSREVKIKAKDKSKHTYVKKYYEVEILYLWEYDIINNIDLCKMLIQEYINNKGKLNNYHSFNYCFENNKLIELENKYVIGY